MKRAPRPLRRLRVLPVLLALAGAQARADDLLGGAYRRAQDLVRDWHRERESRPAPDTWSEGVQQADESEAAVDVARRQLAEVEAMLAALQPLTRAWLEQHTSAEDRVTADALLATLARLHREARAEQAAIQARLVELRGRMASLRGLLAELDLEADLLDAEARALGEDLAALEAREAEARGRIGSLQQVLSQAAELERGLAGETAAARTRYWQTAGDLFLRLGAGRPRDYTSPVEAAPATTARRVLRRSTAPVPVAPLALPVSPAFPVPLAVPLAVPLPLPPVAIPPASAPPFDAAVSTWLDAAGRLQRSQQEAGELLQAVDSTEVAVRRRIEVLAARKPDVDQARTDVEEARRDLSRLAIELQSLHARVPASLAGAFHLLAETTLWTVGQETLSRMLSRLEAHAQLAAHFTWVVRSYGKLLEEDIPSAIEILGPNPSDEAIAKFERLTHLTEAYVADRELGQVLARVTSRPGRAAEEPARPPPARSSVVEEAGVKRELIQRFTSGLKEVVRQAELAYDPAKKRPDYYEMRAALRLETVRRIRLARSPHPGADYVDLDMPRFTVDILRADIGPRYSLADFEHRLWHHLFVKQKIDLVAVRVETPEALELLPEIERAVARIQQADQHRIQIVTP